jgi:poly(glycerol-phosphate) alpha-glucosyltransferase
MIHVVAYSVVASPYQRDLFYALSCLPGISLQVYYLEQASPDAPWPQQRLHAYEKILPGTFLSWGISRFHVHWHLPQVEQADVIILNGYQSSVAQIILRSYADRIPCIFWGETMVATSKGLKGMIQQGLARGLNRCRAIAAIGSRATETYRHQFPHLPIFDIPYYCDLSAFRQDVPLRPRQPMTILFCGQMIQRKGVDLLLQSFDRLVEAGADVRLLLVGQEAELPQMRQSLSDAAQSRIDYAGFQAPESLPQFFRQADLFVLPSRYDGWGVVVNQALGAGLPIVCSDAVGAAKDLVEPGVNGAIVPAGNAEALHDAIAVYLDQPHLLQLASHASLQKAETVTPETGARQWLKIFSQVVC